jgi:hypothetical protein
LPGPRSALRLVWHPLSEVVLEQAFRWLLLSLYHLSVKSVSCQLGCLDVWQKRHVLIFGVLQKLEYVLRAGFWSHQQYRSMETTPDARAKARANMAIAAALAPYGYRYHGIDREQPAPSLATAAILRLALSQLALCLKFAQEWSCQLPAVPRTTRTRSYLTVPKDASQNRLVGKGASAAWRLPACCEPSRSWSSGWVELFHDFGLREKTRGWPPRLDSVTAVPVRSFPDN